MSTQQAGFERTGLLNRCILDGLESEILDRLEEWYKVDARTEEWWSQGQKFHSLTGQDDSFLVTGYYGLIVKHRLNSLRSTSLLGSISEVIGRVCSVLKSEQEVCERVFPNSSQTFKGVVVSVVDESLLPLVNSDDFCNYQSVDDIVELVTQVRLLEVQCGLEANEACTEKAKARYIETELGSMNAKFKVRVLR